MNEKDYKIMCTIFIIFSIIMFIKNEFFYEIGIIYLLIFIFMTGLYLGDKFETKKQN